MDRIFFVCPDYNNPAGGIKQLYRQVEVLNNNNIKAYILHGKKPFKINWFETNAPVLWDYRVLQIDKSKGRKLSLKKIVKTIFKPLLEIGYSSKNHVKFSKDDIIVLPEYYGKDLDKAFKNQSVVIYNQNCYYTFRGCGVDQPNKTSIYKQKRLKAVIVASEDALGYLGLFLKNKPLFRIKYGIDSKLFYYSENKKKQIVFMPRKLKEDAVQVINILYQNEFLKDWNILPIEGLNEYEVAKILKESAIFLSFNHREGFGMPPAEAMACGCIVIGYTGQGGNEIFKPEFSYPVPDRNVQEYVRILEDVIHNYDADAIPFENKGKKASEFILTEYSMNVEQNDIVRTWKAICSN